MDTVQYAEQLHCIDNVKLDKFPTTERVNISAPLAVRPVFVRSICLIYDYLAGNNYPASPHSQGGLKFATQISPLLNLFSYCPTNKKFIVNIQNHLFLGIQAGLPDSSALQG